MITQAALRLDPPVRRTRAAATSTTLQNATRSPLRIRSVPPTASAGRSPAPSGRFAGDTRSGSRTATISAPPPGTPSSAASSLLLATDSGTRYKDTRGSWDKE